MDDHVTLVQNFYCKNNWISRIAGVKRVERRRMNDQREKKLELKLVQLAK